MEHVADEGRSRHGSSLHTCSSNGQFSLASVGFCELPQGAMEMSQVSDDLLIRILAMASSWPHSRVQLTCTRFSRLVPDFRQLAVETLGIYETLMILSPVVSGSLLLDQERGRWLRCADPPVAAHSAIFSASAPGHAVMVFGLHTDDGATRTLAFDPKLNTWRQLPTPFPAYPYTNRVNLVTMDHERVGAHTPESPLLTRAQVVAQSLYTRQYALYDGHVWTPIPTGPVRDVLESALPSTWMIATLEGTVYLTDRRALTTVRKVYAYDTVTRTWTEREMPEHGRSCTFLLGVAGRLYSFGRLADGSSRVDIYDPATESRTTAAYDYDLGIGRGDFVHFNKKLWYTRYKGSSHTYDDPVAVYDWGKPLGVARTKSVLSLPSLPSSFRGYIPGIAVNPHR